MVALQLRDKNVNERNWREFPRWCGFAIVRLPCRVSLPFNDRSPTGRFAFVSSFLDHRHLVTGVTLCIDYEDHPSLSLLRSKWKEFGFGTNFYSIELLWMERNIFLLVYNSRGDNTLIKKCEESRQDFNTNKNIYPCNIPRYPCNGIEN